MSVNVKLKRSLGERYNVKGSLAQRCIRSASYVDKVTASRLVFVAEQLTLPAQHPKRLSEPQLERALDYLLSVFYKPSSTGTLGFLTSLFRFVLRLLALFLIFLCVRDLGILLFIGYAGLLALRPRLFPGMHALLVVAFTAGFLASLFYFGLLEFHLVLPFSLLILYASFEP